MKIIRKRLNLGPSTLGACIAAILLAGCGQSNGALPQSNAGTLSMRLGQATSTLAQPAAGGGAFSGGYSGTEKFRGCTPGRQSGSFKFIGSGKVSFLGRSKETGHLTAGAASSCGWEGAVVLQSSKQQRNRIKMKLEGYVPVNPCAQPLSYTVTGGTGRYSNAKGAGTVAISCLDGSSGTYSDQWSGTISF